MKKYIWGAAILSVVALTAFIKKEDDALFAAARHGDVVAVQAALDAGAKINATNKDGNTALDGAFLHPEVTKLLLEKGADPNKGDYPALISAANNYSLEVMKLLLDAGADPNKIGTTVVDPSVGLKKLIEQEKAKGKDANKASIQAWEGMIAGMSPMKVEANALQQTVQQTNCVPCLKLLFEKGAKPAKSIDGGLAHTLAAFAMSKQQRKEAFNIGSAAMESYDIVVPAWYKNLPDELNGTSVEILEVLIANGIDINKKNLHGQRPLKVAQALVSGATTAEAKANKKALVEALKAAGAK